MTTRNITIVDGFLLLGFSDTWEMQILHAFLFLVIYLLGLAGNFIIITITMLGPQLQSPMYFFLKHLSLLDLSSLFVTVPQSIHNSLTGSGYISKCRWIVTAVWLSGGIPGTLYTATTFSTRFCKSKIIHHFFCDVPQLLKLSCSSDYLGATGVAAFVSTMVFTCFTLSYVQIFTTVLRMPSTEGQSKGLSTCLPHLFVVSFYIFAGIFAYLKPSSHSPTALDLTLSLFYTALPPTLNHVIYSLRNETMKWAIRKLLMGAKLAG